MPVSHWPEIGRRFLWLWAWPVVDWQVRGRTDAVSRPPWARCLHPITTTSRRHGRFPGEPELAEATSVFARPFVKRFALCYRTVALSRLSVTLVHCGKTVGWIKIPLGTNVGLGPGDIVLDGDPAPLPKGTQSPSQF